MMPMAVRPKATAANADRTSMAVCGPCNLPPKPKSGSAPHRATEVIAAIEGLPRPDSLYALIA